MYPMESFPEKLRPAALYFLLKRNNFAVVVSEVATGCVLWEKVFLQFLNNKVVGLRLQIY